jgi:DNA topoisomerase VI subunit A
VVFGVVGNMLSRIPILALVDADPYGLDILFVYKYGSYAAVHEGDTLTAPRIELLGIKITELQGYDDQFGASGSPTFTQLGHTNQQVTASKIIR